jgi:hypothetical protein
MWAHESASPRTEDNGCHNGCQSSQARTPGKGADRPAMIMQDFEFHVNSSLTHSLTHGAKGGMPTDLTYS